VDDVVLLYPICGYRPLCGQVGPARYVRAGPIPSAKHVRTVRCQIPGQFDYYLPAGFQIGGIPSDPVPLSAADTDGDIPTPYPKAVDMPDFYVLLAHSSYR